MNNKLIKEAKNYVNHLLLPLENFYYHQYEHALDVMTRAVYLGQKEGLSEDEIEILALAGLFHDTGFTIQYDNNEFIGAKIARNFLRSKFQDKSKVEIIEKVIIATDPNYQNPQNILEKIIKDADLDNLGRDDFFDLGDRLKKELETIKNIKIKDPDWHHSSLHFLFNHKYFTETQIKEREDKKEENAVKLKEIVKEEGNVDINPNY